MADENKSAENVIQTNAGDYIEQLNNLRQNSVSKADYEKLLADNKKLATALANGEYNQQQKTESPVDINELRKSLFNEDNNNLQYCEKALKLRKALMDSGQIDPFVPTGRKINPTQFDFDTAEKVAQVMQECVDYAQGDSQLFTQELQRRTR